VQPARVIVQLDEQRHGAAWCRNTALAMVDTEWTAWLDDDDEFLPNHLKVLLRGANRSRADLIYSYAEFVGGPDPLAGPNPAGEWVANPINCPHSAYSDLWLRTNGNFIPCCYIAKTAIMKQVGGFPEPWSMPDVKHSADCEDYLMLLNMLAVGARFHHVVGVRTWRYNYWDGNLGGRGVNRLHEIESGERP
jgi:glycosyltransferase involved in cell wall biosynthesis